MESLQTADVPQLTRPTIPTQLTKQATPPSDGDALRWNIETTKLKEWPRMSDPLRIDNTFRKNMIAFIVILRKWNKE
jgi:hypothetical protein